MDNLSKLTVKSSQFSEFPTWCDKVEIEMLFRVYFRSGKKKYVIWLFYETDAMLDKDIMAELDSWN